MKIIEPTILIDKEKCLENIEVMHLKAKQNNLIFRPHFKTHQSQEIGDWFRAKGVDKITVSSLNMALYFAESGWRNITVAFPLNILEIDKINQLAGKIQLNLLAVHHENLIELANQLKHPIGIFIKIDVGTNRTGIQPDDTAGIDEILEVIDNSLLLEFKGFLAHAGHTYSARNQVGVQTIHEDCLKRISGLKPRYSGKYPELIISYGDTPSCSAADSFEGIDELRPGNFVFYDLTQVEIGSCSIDQIAVVLACPVVAKHEDRNEIILYGGGVHLSKDRLVNEENLTIFGKPVLLDGNGWKISDKLSYLKSISQEHGVLKVSPELFNKIKIGDVIGILPVHSCMMVDLFSFYVDLAGNRIEKI